MSSVNDTSKANEAANPDYINLKVRSQEGEEIYFKIKKTTSFKKLMDTYCSRGNVLICLFSCQSTMWGSYLMGIDWLSFRLLRMYWFDYLAEYGEWRWDWCHDWTIRRMIGVYGVYFEVFLAYLNSDLFKGLYMISANY